jgi:hypothetical protein
MGLGVVMLMIEGVGGVRRQAGVEKSVNSCYFIYIIKEITRDEGNDEGGRNGRGGGLNGHIAIDHVA